MKQIIVFLFLMLCGMALGADDIRFVDPTDGENGTGGHDGTTMALAWQTLTYAFANHTAGSGETCTFKIKDDETTADANIALNSAAKQDGIDFILRGETASGRWTIGCQQTSGWFIRCQTNMTSGSITIQRADWTSSAASRFILVSNDVGMDFTVEDCVITLTKAASQGYYSLGGTAASRDLTIIGDTTIMVAGEAILSYDGNITIGDGVTLSSSTAAKPVIFLAGDPETLTIGAATLNQTAGSDDASRAIYVNINTPMDSITLDGTTISSWSNCLLTTSCPETLLIRNCVVTSVGGNGIVLGVAPTSEKDYPIVRSTTIIGNAVNATASGSRALYIQTGVDNAVIYGNRMTADSHALLVQSDGGTISYNTVVAVTAVGLGVFGDNWDIHHNTVYTPTGSITTSAAGGTAPTQRASRNLKIHDNVFVASDGFAYNDYDASTGTTAARGSTVTIDETTTATDTDGSGVMTGTGSAWDTAGVKEVVAGDIVRVTAGTGVTPNDYFVKSVESDTQITLTTAMGNYAPASADLVYTIVRGDGMNDYVDYNCYWRVANQGSGYTKMGPSGSESTPISISAIQTVWATWNTNYGTINDQNSDIFDPQLDGNYQAKSPLLNGTGSPLLVDTDGTIILRSDIGATKFTGGSPSILNGTSTSILGN